MYTVVSMQALRRQLVGALPLSEQEHHAHLLQQLREDKREAESIRERARRDQERVQVSYMYKHMSFIHWPMRFAKNIFPLELFRYHQS